MCSGQGVGAVQRVTAQDLSVASQASRARSNSNHSIGHSVTFEEARVVALRLAYYLALSARTYSECTGANDAGRCRTCTAGLGAEEVFLFSRSKGCRKA